jgi:tetratricopeptide (TPR) repeat protein
MTAETLRDVSNFILWAGLIAAAFGTAGVNYFRARLEREREAEAKTKEQQVEFRASALQTKVGELLKGNEAVVTQNEKLLADIKAYQQDLQARDQRIRELETAAKAAKRGVVDRYDFNGAKRIQSGGSVSVVAGAEFGVFQKLVALEKSRDYAALIRVTEDQIARTPEWLTPYLFLGLAYANTGNTDKALRNLQYVVEQAAGDPQYKRAEELLAKLRRTR